MNKIIILTLFAAVLCCGQGGSIHERIYEKRKITKINDSIENHDVQTITLIKDSVEFKDELYEINKSKDRKGTKNYVGIGGGFTESKGKYYFVKDTMYLKMIFYRIESSNLINDQERQFNITAIKNRNKLILFRNEEPETLLLRK